MTPLGRNWCRWEENIIFFRKEIGRNGVDSGSFPWTCHEPSGSIKGRIFLDKVANYWLFKGSAPCSMLANSQWVFWKNDGIINNFLQQQALLNTVISVTIFEVTKLKTLIQNLATAALLCKQLHILRGCPITQKKQIVLVHDVRLLEWLWNETLTHLGQLDLEDRTDRLFLNVGK